MSTDLDDYYIDEPDPMAEVESGNARLDKKYYRDRVKYFFGGKKKYGKRPRREDYLIYPPTPEQVPAPESDAPAEPLATLETEPNENGDSV